MRNAAAIAFGTSALLLCTHASARAIDDLAACSDQREARTRLSCYDRVTKILIVETRTREEAAAKLQQEREREKELQGKQEAAAKVDREQEKQLLAKQDAAGRDAVRALKKLQARTRAGVAYRDYSSALAEAKLDVETYLDGSQARKKPEFAARLGRALIDYETANTVWNLKFGGGGGVNQWVLFRNVESDLIQKYPGMDSARQNGNIRIDFALPVIWSSASNHIAEAAKMIEAE